MSNPMFSFWRCCLKGETKPKLKKSVKKKNKGGPVEVAQEAKQDDTVDNSELEYKKNELPHTSTPVVETTDEYTVESNALMNSDVNESVSGIPSETDSSMLTPSTIQIVKDGGSVPEYTEIGSGGRLHLRFNYLKDANKLNVNIQKIEFAAYQDWKQQDLEVSCMLLPLHQQSFRRRSKRFDELIIIQLPPKGKLSGSSLRFRIYDHKAITRKYLIGQGVVSLDDLALNGDEVVIVLDLNSPDTYGIDTRYVAGIDQNPGENSISGSKPEILISLEYRALTRKLVVEVIKTRNLGIWRGSKPQDIGVELKLLSKDKQVLRICRTNVKRHVIDTEFNEMFMFRLNIERLKEVTMQFAVIRYSEVRGKKEVVGDCAFGLGSTGHEQQEHWDNMLRGEAKAEYRWHTLYK